MTLMEESTLELTPAGQRRKGLHFGALALVGFAACVLFLGELLFVNKRTPLIIIAPAPYGQPFAPLAWSQEDVAALNELDQETLAISDISGAWKGKNQGLRRLNAELQNISYQFRSGNEVVLYFRTHSAVDGNGVPCLILPDASACRSETWLPLADVFEKIRDQSLPDSVQKLVILDCSDVLVNWNHGVLFNTFAMHVPEVVKAAAIPNLVVILAAGPGEVSAAYPHARQSIFGHFLRRGLGGEADWKSESGNGDRMVSVDELHRYLIHHVDRCSHTLFGRSQRPMLISGEHREFDVAGILNPQIALQILARRKISEPRVPAVSIDKIAELWKRFEKARELEGIRFEPVFWIGVGHQLVWLELAAESGTAYDKTALRLYDDLSRLMERIQTGTQQPSTSEPLPVRWMKVASDDKNPLPLASSSPLHSTRLSEFFGTMPPRSLELIRELFSRFRNEPTVDNLEDVVTSLTKIDPDVELKQTSFLVLLKRYGVIERWQDVSVIQAAIELHELAESVSVPEDERVVDWIRQEVDTADALRRKVDDQLFLGSVAPTLELLKAKLHYNNAIHISTATAKAFRLRSKVASELPCLAQWLTRPPVASDSPSETPAEALAVLARAIRNLIALEGQLSSPSTQTVDETLSLPFEGAVVQLEADHDRLLQMFDEEYERLLRLDEDHAGVFVLNDMMGLLSLPLLPQRNSKLESEPAQQRNALHDKFNRLRLKAFEQFKASAANDDRQVVLNPGNDLADSDREFGKSGLQTTDYLERLMIETPEHVAITLVRRNGDARATLPTEREAKVVADQLGQIFRESLTAIHGDVKREIEEQMTTSAPDVSHRPGLGGWCIRAAATSDAISAFEVDPVVWQRRQDLVQLLTWNSQRFLDDFWGLASRGGKSFFDASTVDTLRAAQSIAVPKADSRIRMDAIKSLLDKRRTAAIRGLTTKADELLLVEEDEPSTIKVDVSRNLHDGVSLPAGQAVVFVRDSQGHPVSEFRSLVIPSPDAALPATPVTHFDLPFFGKGMQRIGSELKAVTLFRGHEFVSDLPLNSAAGIVVDYTPPVVKDSRVTVRGRNRRKLSILFVLDCSASMQTGLPLENEAGNAPRLEIAKLALHQMFEKLAEDEANRVGLILFGHRVGWNLKQSGELLRQSDYTVPIPDRTRPYDDVETILPLGRFNSSFAASVDAQLKSVRPWGESPLYLALLQAVRQFQTEENDVEKAIVVITDGMNYQFNPPSSAKKTAADVLAATGEHPVPIHIVGLGIAADQSREAQLVFGELAQKTGGTYVPAQAARALIETLESLRRPKTFRVTDTAMQESVADVSRPVTVTPRADDSIGFKVAFGEATEWLQLRGGESIELMPTRDGQHFETTGYGSGQTQWNALVDGEAEAPTDLIVGLHRPIRQRNSVKFEVSIQHAKHQFVPRPAEVWIDITPVVPATDTSKPTYVFYDAIYVPYTSVPVLQWVADQWPANATRARVRIWCKMKATPPTQVVSQLNSSNTDSRAEFHLPGLPEIQLGIRERDVTSSQVLVVERHSVNSPEIAALKVEFSSASPPLRVTHRFDAANRLATHRFQFPKEATAATKAGEIRLTTRKALQEGALHTADAILVDVTESADVLESRPGR